MASRNRVGRGVGALFRGRVVVHREQQELKSKEVDKIDGTVSREIFHLAV
jgi:hypothetical protein